MATSSDLDALVVIVDRNSQLLFRQILTNDVLIQKGFYFSWFRQGLANGSSFSSDIIRYYFITDINTFVADEDRWARYEFLDIVLALVAERTAEDIVSVLFHLVPPE